MKIALNKTTKYKSGINNEEKIIINVKNPSKRTKTPLSFTPNFRVELIITLIKNRNNKNKSVFKQKNYFTELIRSLTNARISSKFGYNCFIAK